MHSIHKNLLPIDGLVNYYGPIFKPNESNLFFWDLIESIEWKNDELILFGKKTVTKRKVAWYGDKPFSYQYSNTNKQALAWTDTLKIIKNIIEAHCGETFNSCLLNLYHDGSEGMSWHSDNEKEIVTNSTICSLSFGAERKFVFKHKQHSSNKVSLVLENGSLLLMKGCTQTHWNHSVAKSMKINQARINLTFRQLVQQ